MTDLDKVANRFFLHDSAGNGPSLKYAGSDISPAEFGAWIPLGAEKVGSGYQVVWQTAAPNSTSSGTSQEDGSLEEPVRRGLRFGGCMAGRWKATLQQGFNADGSTGLNHTDRDVGRDTPGPGGQRVLPA